MSSHRPLGFGALTDADKTRIEELAATGLNAYQIAERIERHQSTVQWFMYANGLQAPKPAPQKATSYVRNGRVVHRYSAAEDELITSLRAKGSGLADIARRASEQFGTARTSHTIHVRLTMLGARDDEGDAA